MQRRNLMGTALALCALVAVAGTSAQAATELRLTHVQQPNSVTGKGIEMFADKVAEYTGGDVTVRIYPASQLGNNKENVASVRTGTIPMGVVTYPLLADIVPEFSVYNAGYFFEDEEALRRVLDAAELGQKWNATLLERGGVRILGSSYYGRRHLTTGETPVRTLDDVKGMKIRAVPNEISLAIIRGMGATPTPVPFSELFQALRQGVVDGQENPLPTIEANKLYEVQNHLMLTGHQLIMLPLVINERAWEDLSSEQQEAVQRAAEEAEAWIPEETKRQEAELVDTLEKEGMTVIGPEDGLEVEAFQDAVRAEVAKTFEGPKWPEGLVDDVVAVASGS
jgi:TRAP-type transport system periplasmic protein